MATLTLRESVLDFLTCYPTAWRTSALAAKLGVTVKCLEPELSQLKLEGKLISCTVQAPGRRPQQEYRIAAFLRQPKPREFVISRQTNVRFRHQRPGTRTKKARTTGPWTKI